MAASLLIYGVSGYTGALISRMAAEKKLAHLAGGRTAAAVAAHAQALELETRVFSLDDPVALDAALAGVTVVLNCAGPFARTARPLAEACIRVGAHYLDLAGEVPEFESLRRFDAQARSAGVMLMPGVGFGIVPTDCLAMEAKQRLPSATHLTLAFETVGGVSQGTLGTLLHDLHRSGVVRQNGALIPARAASQRCKIDFGHGPRTAVLNPWRGDIATAFYSTGIPNITAYTVFPAPLPWLMGASTYLGPLLDRPGVQRQLQRLVQRLPPGPDQAALARGSTRVWAEATNAAGERATVRLQGPEAYLFTARTALSIARQALAGKVADGFQTPAQVYGADFVRSIEGVTVL